MYLHKNNKIMLLYYYFFLLTYKQKFASNKLDQLTKDYFLRNLFTSNALSNN